MSEEEVEDLRSQVAVLETRLDEVQHDRESWSQRALEAEDDFETAHERANELDEELDAACRRIDEMADDYARLDNDLDEARADLEIVRHERDCYKAVLVEMEFNNVDDYPNHGLEYCEALGSSAKEIIQKLTNTKE